MSHIHNAKSQQVTAPVQLSTPLAGQHTCNDKPYSCYLHTMTLCIYSFCTPSWCCHCNSFKLNLHLQHGELCTRLPSRISSPLLPGDDEDVIEEEEVDLLPWRPLEEDAAVLYECSQLSSLHHPPGGGHQRERLGDENEEHMIQREKQYISSC